MEYIVDYFLRRSSNTLLEKPLTTPSSSPFNSALSLSLPCSAKPKMVSSSSSSSSCMAAACFLAALLSAAAARQYMVGGSAGWAPPASGTMSFNDWAGKNRFLVGDSLVFKYNPSVDSVARVSAEDYNSCSAANPIASFKDGNTFFQFPSHGPFYFISGNSSNCNMGEKLIVVVISPRNATSHVSHSPSPSPTTAAAAPSPSPTASVLVPSPAPATTVLTPSPAPTTTVLTPSPAPTTAATAPSPAPITAAATPTPAPSMATPVAPSMSPAGAPTNSEPLNTSPGPAPMGNRGGESPAGMAPAAAVPYLVYVAVTLVTVALSGGALTFGN